MKIFLSALLTLFVFNTTVSAVEEIDVDVKRRPHSEAWKSYRTTIISKAERDDGQTSGEVNRYGGGATPVSPGTVFFHVQKINEVWVIVDPEGGLFISKGLNSVRMGKTNASKSAFASHFGTTDNWPRKTLKDLQAAGFNTLGSWTDWRQFQKPDARMPYTITWNFMEKYGRKVGGVYQQSGHVGYPQDCIYVFDKAFEDHCDELAKQMLEVSDDPYLLGHFSDNEMPLRLNMLDRFLELKKSQEGYLAAVAWLNRRGVERAAITDEIREAFVEYAAEQYFRVVKQAIRKHDPNHMYLGCRFHGQALTLKPLFKAAKEHVDVLSINWYWQWTPDTEKMDNWKQWSDRPFIITEFYAKGMDSGMGNKSGAGWVVKTQRDRGYFYQNFTLGLLKHPNCVGWHWHRYMDNDPAAGQDPSNVDSNKGIVTSKYEPHEDLVSEMATMNAAVHNLREGMLQANSNAELPTAE
ncbi:MAG: agarase [Fuerstiella sp.]|nr:agarase [Fuerstiella sp.]MCP4855323.1 agarase [Fuerstiella sp.]